MTKKLDKTQRELLLELHQGIYGLPHTEEYGLIGDVKKLVIQVELQNNRIRKSEQKIFKLWGILIGVGVTAGVAVGLGLRIMGI